MSGTGYHQDPKNREAQVDVVTSYHKRRALPRYDLVCIRKLDPHDIPGYKCTSVGGVLAHRSEVSKILLILL